MTTKMTASERAEWESHITRHAPATPLPWKCGTKYPSRILNVANTEQPQDEDCPSLRAKDDAAYIAHAANAYPRLVAHLIAACRSMERSGNESSALEAQSSRALLRELGELDA